MPDLGEDNLRLARIGRKSILEQGQEQIRDVTAGLQEGDQVAVSATASDRDGDGTVDATVGAAFDVGKGLKVGVEATKTESGVGWFAGGLWRWGRKK